MRSQGLPNRGCRIAWPMLLLVVATAPAAAQPAVERLLDRARLQLEDGYFEESLRLLERARVQADRPAIRAQVDVHAGLCRFFLGHPRRAEQLFSEALRLDPRVSLDPEKFKPDLVALFARTRRKVQGTLHVVSSCSGAQVWLDGHRIGRTPLSRALPVGEHRLTLRCGERSHEQQVLVSWARTTHVELPPTAAPRAAVLVVRSSPAGARVWLDGHRIGRTPLRRELPPGSHELALTHQGYLRYHKTLQAAPGAEAVVDARLTARSDGHRPGRRWTWVAGGAALAASAVGAGLTASAVSDYDEYRSTSDRERFFELEEQIRSKRIAFSVMYGVAGALAVTAAVLYWLEGRGSQRSRAVSLSPGGLVLRF